jgi:hypothetical protein
MDRIHASLALIAEWGAAQDDMHDLPESVRWEDGSAATLEDYFAHRSDTQRWVEDPSGGMRLHLYPDVIADVRYDGFGRVWGLSGDAVEPEALYVRDPDASDYEITMALSALPMTYRHVIHRDVPVAVRL